MLSGDVTETTLAAVMAELLALEDPKIREVNVRPGFGAGQAVPELAEAG